MINNTLFFIYKKNLQIDKKNRNSPILKTGKGYNRYLTEKYIQPMIKRRLAA